MKLRNVAHEYRRLGFKRFVSFSLRWFYLHWLEWEGSRFDRQSGVETIGVNNAADPVYADIVLSGNPYRGVAPSAFRACMEALPIRFEDYQFVDLGSGKGRALFLAAQYPFQRIVGVELSASLHDIAKSNLTAFSRIHPGGPPIETINGDAADFEIDARSTVYFCFNALPPHVISEVASQIPLTTTTGLPNYWVQVNPLRDSSDALHGAANLRLVHEVRRKYRKQHSFLVFRSR